MAIKAKLLVACALGLCLWAGWAGADTINTNPAAPTGAITAPPSSTTIAAIRTDASERKPVKNPGTPPGLSKTAFALTIGVMTGGCTITDFPGGDIECKGTIPSFDLTLGRRPKRQVIVGGGVGYEVYPNASSIPLYFLVRYSFFDNPSTPYIYGNAGYGISHLNSNFGGENDSSGVLFGFGGGGSFLGPTGLGLEIDAGLRIEASKYYWRYIYPNNIEGPVYQRDVTYKYFRLTIGLRIL